MGASRRWLLGVDGHDLDLDGDVDVDVDVEVALGVLASLLLGLRRAVATKKVRLHALGGLHGYQLKWTKCLQTVYNCRHFRLPTSRALRRAQRAPETCLRLVSSSTWTAQAVVGGPGHPPAAKVSCRHAQERGRRKEGQPFFSKNGCSERVPREVRAARVRFPHCPPCLPLPRPVQHDHAAAARAPC